MTRTNLNCLSQDVIPPFNELSILANITTVFTPGSDALDPRMTECCAPNPANVAMVCYEWCEVLHRYGSSYRKISDHFMGCTGGIPSNTSHPINIFPCIWPARRPGGVCRRGSLGRGCFLCRGFGALGRFFDGQYYSSLRYLFTQP